MESFRGSRISLVLVVVVVVEFLNKWQISVCAESYSQYMYMYVSTEKFQILDGMTRKHTMMTIDNQVI